MKEIFFLDKSHGQCLNSCKHVHVMKNYLWVISEIELTGYVILKVTESRGPGKCPCNYGSPGGEGAPHVSFPRRRG